MFEKRMIEAKIVQQTQKHTVTERVQNDGPDLEAGIELLVGMGKNGIGRGKQPRETCSG